MALIPCPECKKEISNKAASCPNCGCVIKKKRSGCLSFILVLFLFTFVMSYFFYEKPTGRKASQPKPSPQNSEQSEQPKNEEAKPKTLQEASEEYEAKMDDIRKDLRERLFVGSGEVLPLKFYIQDNLMHDPKSYEHVKTEILDEKRWFMIVKTTFRGTNKFGAVVRNTVTAKVHLKGDILEIIKAE